MENLQETWNRLTFPKQSAILTEKKKKDDPCEDGYMMMGTKDKDGQEVPNCVDESDDPIEEGISNWKNLIAEDGFDKEKKDKMKCNSPRRLRKGEPGHGDKSKVVKACDPNSDKETIKKFGDPSMPVQAQHKDNKASFRARHKCDDKSMEDDWDSAGYWACKDW